MVKLNKMQDIRVRVTRSDISGIYNGFTKTQNMKQKLLILQGVPAAGKSTYANNFIKDNFDTWVIVSRDSIRKMSGVYWVPKREHYIQKAELNCVIEALKGGFSVINDSTNLNAETILQWQDIAKIYDIDIEFKEIRISYKEALQRDSLREYPVGELVIRHYFEKYYKHLLIEQ